MKLVLYLSTVFLLVFASQSLIGGAPSDQANFLLITVDTLRADRVSCYDSSHLQTPHFNGLAEQGAVKGLDRKMYV